tara:strand:+ start:6073 stop:6417 length:345 start_codon:yes stop_codon:yes gene_type:complete
MPRNARKTPERPPSERNGAAAKARLRDDIDRGAAGDKVAFSDPAAAPLGTDEEAAGTPPDPAAVDWARDAERRAAHGEKKTPHDLETEARLGVSTRWAIAGLVILLAVLAFLAI